MSASVSSKRNWPAWWRRLRLASRRARLINFVEIGALVAFFAAIVTAGIMLNAHSARGELLPASLTASLLVAVLVPAMALLVLLGRRIALRSAAENVGGSGRLHVQLVFLFSMIASIPTLLVVIFASFLFQSGVEFWFSDNSRGLLENANKLARGYYEQSQRDVSNETIAMASDLRYILGQTTIVSREFAESFSYQVVQRKLDEVAILQKGPDGALRTAAIVDPNRVGSNDKVNPAEIRRLEGGETIIVNANSDRIEAVTPIDLRTGLFLYTARKSDLLALSQGRRAENIVRAYQVLTQRARLLQLRFNVALLIASLALVGLAVWFALRFADRQVQPLYQLVGAARRVGAGNYAIRIEGRTGTDEIGLLNRAFNRMTGQIERQTLALIGANQQLEERRAFIEVVLESVTAGVISLDPAGDILLMNSSAQKLLIERGGEGSTPLGQPMAAIAPAIAALAEGERAEAVIQHARGGELLTLAVRLTHSPAGHVITFEDITRQLLDQRQAAWSDVARRIAHEIKNPLTPIQLATERLKRRYRRQIETDGELFEELTGTIIRQVGDLRKMVDEFSSFARLPKPVFRPEDPVDLARQALFLQEVAHPQIAFAFKAPVDVDRIACDRHQFGQAMTNVVKNATEAIDAQARVAPEGYRGRIDVALADDGIRVTIAVTDNGVGLPQDRDRIIEPYVTTREKGTGLGLAIVKKIVEEHGGDIVFASAEGGGTRVTMRFARDPLDDSGRGEGPRNTAPAGEIPAS